MVSMPIVEGPNGATFEALDVAEVDLAERGAPSHCLGEVRPAQHRRAKVRPAEVQYWSEIRPAEVRAVEACPTEGPPSEVCPAEVGDAGLGLFNGPPIPHLHALSQNPEMLWIGH